MASVLATAVVNIVTNNTGFTTGMARTLNQISGFIDTASGMMEVPFVSKPLRDQLNTAKADLKKAEQDVAHYTALVAQRLPTFAQRKAAVHGLTAANASLATAQKSIIAVSAAAKAAGVSNAFMAAGFTVFGVKAAKTASQLNTELDLTVQTFGHLSSGIYRTADAMQSKWGMVRQEILAVTTAFGEMFNKVGLGGKAGAQMSSQLAELARDLASNRGISFGEAAGQIQGAMGGSGQFFDEARVEVRAFRMNLMRLHQPMTDTARQFVRQQLLMESMEVAQAEAVANGPRLSDELSALGGNLGRITTVIGSLVLPVFQGLLSVLNLLIGRLADFAEWLQSSIGTGYQWYKNLFGDTSEMSKQIREDEIGRKRAEQQAQINADLAMGQAMHTRPRMAVHSGFEEFRKKLLEGASGGQFALQKQLVDLSVQQNQRLQQIANNTMRAGAPGPLPVAPALAAPH